MHSKILISSAGLRRWSLAVIARRLYGLNTDLDAIIRALKNVLGASQQEIVTALVDLAEALKSPPRTGGTGR